MDRRLSSVLDQIGEDFKMQLHRGARHYREVNIGQQAVRMGYADLGAKLNNTFAIVPLMHPHRGMKVRIDGRTFVNYAEHPSGIAVPGYVASEAGAAFKSFVPNDSMICNFA